MADQTAYLNLTLIGFNEYADAWGYAINNNWEALDLWSSRVEGELLDARLSKPTLKELLEVGHNSDGTLKATGEVVLARKSRHFGLQDSLSERISVVEKDVWLARAGEASLRDGLTVRDTSSKVLSGPANWMTFTGADVKVDGSTTPVWFAIGGKLARIRSLQKTTVTGNAYIYVRYQEDGLELVSSSTGTTLMGAGDEVTYFVDSGKNFNTEVKPGDILRISGQSDASINKDYIVKTVAPGGVSNRLEIQGAFPAAGLTSVTYKVIDPFGVTLGNEASKVPLTGKFHIGTCSFAASAVTAVAAISLSSTFVSEWVSVSSGGDYFTTTGIPFSHNLMSDEVDVSVHVRASSSATEIELHTGAKLKWNDQKVWVKTPLGVDTFYTDFSGSVVSSGQLRIVVRKKG